jgi:ribose transport system permease protein
VLFYFIASVFLRNTASGRAIYAVGGNESAARLSGIHVNRTRLLAFVLAGLTAAIAGVLMTDWTLARLTMDKGWNWQPLRPP